MLRRAVALFLLSFALPLFAADPAVEALMTQGRNALGAGDTEKAIDLFKQAVAKAPKCADCHKRLGDAYGSAAQKASIFGKASLASKCKDEYDLAVQLDPNLLPARFSLIEFYLQAPGFMGGSESKAVEQANEIKKRDVFQGHRAFARIYEYQKKPDQVRAEYQAMIKEQPNAPKAHYWWGVYLLSVDKNNAAATAEFETSVKLDPNYMPGWFQVGHMAALTGTNMPRGEEALKRYLGYTPTSDEPGIHRAHYWLGAIYEKQGKKAEAKAAYAQSLKLNGSQKDAQEALKRVS